jgi:hypothetical protein
MKIEDPLPDFFTTLSTPSKEFENDSGSMGVFNFLKLLALHCRSF